MRELIYREADVVSGGLIDNNLGELSIYASTYIRSSSDMANIYGTDGYGRQSSPPPRVNCTQAITISTNTTTTSTTTSPGCTITSTPPYISCSFGSPSTTSTTTTSVNNVISCTP